MLEGVAAPTRDPLEIVLERTGEVAGRVLRPSGEPVSAVTVRIFDPAAESKPFASAVTGGDGRFSFPSVPPGPRVLAADAMGELVAGGRSATLGGGRVRLTTVPAGQWQLLVRASVPGAGTLSRPILAPGELGNLELPAAGTLRVRVAALEEAPVPAAVTLFASDGRLYRSVGAGGTVHRRWPLVGGRATIPNVTAGLLTVRVEAADGGSWTGSVRVPPGGVVELSL